MKHMKKKNSGRNRVGVGAGAALLTLLLAILLGVSSCVPKISATELSLKGAPITVPQSGTLSDDRYSETVIKLTDLSLRLAALSAEKGESSVVSPISALICLALMANGANGETLAQIETALGVEIEELNAFMADLTATVLGYDNESCELRLASSIWIKEDAALRVNDEFLRTNAQSYRAQIYSSPFDKRTARDINAWIERSTDGLIKDMLDEADPSAMMYLISTVAMDAKWQEKYEKSAVRDSAFTNYSGETKQVETMFSTEGRYLANESCCGFVKNYHGGRYALATLLPNEGVDVYDMLSTLSGESWKALLDGCKSGVIVKTSMPSFSIEQRLDLAASMAALGITDMFDSDAADFSRLGSYGGEGLYCSSFEQKTVIDVNSDGTRAASASVGVMAPTSAGPSPEEQKIYQVYLTRPFIAAVIDLETGLPMFISVVSEA